MEEYKKHKFIVITGDTGNALGVVRSIGEAGIAPIVIYLVEESHLPLLIKSKYLNTVHKVYSYEDAVDLLIKEYGNEKEKPFVYTCDDSIGSIIDERFDDLVEKFYFFNAGETGRINQLMNKHTICEIAESCGFKIPKQEVVDRGVLPKKLKYPIITKTLMSIMGAWKGDVYICNNEEELKEAYSKIQSPKLLLQEYIEKKNELDFEGYSIDNGKQVCIPFQISYFRFSGKGYGHYIYIKPSTNGTIKKQLAELIKKCNFSGCFEIEFLVDKNDQLWFLEVNFRFSFWNYAVTFGGINYPISWAKDTLSNKVEDVEKGSIRQYFTAMSEPGDFGQSVAGGKISFFKWLGQLLKSDMLFFYNPKDKLPALSFWFHKFTRKLKRV